MTAQKPAGTSACNPSVLFALILRVGLPKEKSFWASQIGPRWHFQYCRPSFARQWETGVAYRAGKSDTPDAIVSHEPEQRVIDAQLRTIIDHSIRGQAAISADVGAW